MQTEPISKITNEKKDKAKSTNASFVGSPNGFNNFTTLGIRPIMKNTNLQVLLKHNLFCFHYQPIPSKWQSDCSQRVAKHWLCNANG